MHCALQPWAPGAVCLALDFAWRWTWRAAAKRALCCGQKIHLTCHRGTACAFRTKKFRRRRRRRSTLPCRAYPVMPGVPPCHAAQPLVVPHTPLPRRIPPCRAAYPRHAVRTPCHAAAPVMLRAVAASRKSPQNGLSPEWPDCATGARNDEVEDPTP